MTSNYSNCEAVKRWEEANQKRLREVAEFVNRVAAVPEWWRKEKFRGLPLTIHQKHGKKRDISHRQKQLERRARRAAGDFRLTLEVDRYGIIQTSQMPPPDELPFDLTGITTAYFYECRDRVAIRLGYKGYPAYRASNRWKKTRRGVFALDAGLCRVCSKTATEVHHDRYDLKTMAGADYSHLHSVCRPCHEYLEFVDWDGKKETRRTPHEMYVLTRSKVSDALRAFLTREPYSEDPFTSAPSPLRTSGTMACCSG